MKTLENGLENRPHGNQGISVIVPVYRSTDSLRILVERVTSVLQPFGNFEVILVDDGSPKDTWNVVEELALNSSKVTGLRLGRNYGQHSALVAGVRAAKFPITVTIDDDLQNPPEEIPRLVEYLHNNNLEVVYGVPRVAKQSLSRRMAGRGIRRVLSAGLGAGAATEMSSFRAFHTASREAFNSDLGDNVSLDALLTWGNSRFGSALVQHDSREHGRSNYSFRKLLRFSIDTITGYSTVPLQVASVLGLLTSFFGFGVLIYVVAVPILSGQSVQGFPFLASTIAIFAGVQLLTLGILGEYLARMHFRVMRKPTYFVAEITGPISCTGANKLSAHESRTATIPFNRPTFASSDLEYLSEALKSGHSSGNGPFTHRAERLLEEIHGVGSALLTTSCTHALELSARLLDLQPGDEVIVPSYTFVSTASAFMWNGARPVFADVNSQTLNIDPDSVESLISNRTRAICIVHYAGVGAQPERFVELADKYGLTLIEDNAHGLGASHNGQILGTFGSMSTLSFHETKNITCGEGGALIINDPALLERAEILREKGTNRTNFMRGRVDKYRWVDNGSSWVMSDLLASLLTGQLERMDQINSDRISIWSRYHESLPEWADKSQARLPSVPTGSRHTGHMYYLRFSGQKNRHQFIEHLRQREVASVFHYQPLHRSPVGVTLQEDTRHCVNSDNASQTLARLPMFTGMSEEQQDQVVAAVLSFRPHRDGAA